jgi:hypothetical protein
MTVKEKIALCDDAVIDEEDGTTWTGICQSCVDKLNIPDSEIHKGEGYGICGIENCWNDSEHLWFLEVKDMDMGEN